jgi:hypothetical protein
MGKLTHMVTGEWDITWFYLATLSLVFIGGCIVRIIAG